MIDIYLTKEDGKFGDVVFDYETMVVKDAVPPAGATEVRVQVLRTTEDEPKLLQSLKKLVLNEELDHPVGYGVDHSAFSIDEIVKALTFYNESTQTTSPSEVIQEILGIQQVGYNFEVRVRTLAGTIVSLGVGA